jgi:hypothetical protein
MALTRDQSFFVVRRLAQCYSRPEVVAAFARAFPGVRCDIEDVKAFDPTEGLTDPMLCNVYKAVQAEFLAESPLISKRTYRLAILQRLLKDAIERGAPGLQMSVLAQAREEMAGSEGEPGGGAGGRRITQLIETIIDPVAA